jgi:tRNA-dihydrouridine synthase C
MVPDSALVSDQASIGEPSPQLLLAPMEGLLDFVLRDVLTRVGGFDRCVSEFIRVTDQLLPQRVFLRIMPELGQGSRTDAGVPVRGQLLGSDPACMADNAARLAELGSQGVDLNFGCPAKVVNRHGGGAVLLKDPDQLYRIVEAVRSALAPEIPVSAKMRLGFDHDRDAQRCALAIEAGGACELVVHARTKADGYRPPAYWHRIADLRSELTIPVVANGEIWTVEDARRCLRESGAGSIMLGRGAVADPALGWRIRQALQWSAAGCERVQAPALNPGLALLPHLEQFWRRVCERVEPRARAGRLKQWLYYLRRASPLADRAYQQLRTVTDSAEVTRWLAAQSLRSSAGWCASPSLAA